MDVDSTLTNDARPFGLLIVQEARYQIRQAVAAFDVRRRVGVGSVGCPGLLQEGHARGGIRFVPRGDIVVHRLFDLAARHSSLAIRERYGHDGNEGGQK